MIMKNTFPMVWIVFAMLSAGCRTQRAEIFVHRPENHGSMNVLGTQLVLIPLVGPAARMSVVTRALVGGQFSDIGCPPGEYDLRVESHSGWDSGTTHVWVSEWQRIRLAKGQRRYFVILPEAKGSEYVGAWDLVEVPTPEEWKIGVQQARSTPSSKAAANASSDVR
mgnify:CR=1 FL=1